MKNFSILAMVLLSCAFVHGQQAHTDKAPDYAANSRYVQGVGIGYAPSCTHASGPPGDCPGTDMVIHFAAGSVNCGGSIREDAAGTYTVTHTPTAYVYQDPGSSCAFNDQSSSDVTGLIPYWKVTSTGGHITAIASDYRGAPTVSNFQVTGNTRVLCSTSGSFTSGHLVSTDSNHNCIDSGIAGNNIRDCEIVIGDPGSSSVALANDNDTPAVCGNDFGVDYTITAVACWADAGSPTVTPILTGGSSTSILTGALTCGTASWAAGTVNGTPTVHSFSSNGATCSSTPCTLDGNITTAGGTAKYIVIRIKRTL